jgi:hypothetical protein
MAGCASYFVGLSASRGAEPYSWHAGNHYRMTRIMVRLERRREISVKGQVVGLIHLSMMNSLSLHDRRTYLYPLSNLRTLFRTVWWKG